MSRTQKLHRRIIHAIPFFNNIFIISNTYACSGDFSSLSHTASLKFWYERIIKHVCICLIISFLFYSFPVCYGYGSSTFNPTSLVLSIFPNLLGFGIAVFALFFALPSDFSKLIKKIQSQLAEKGKTSKISANMLLVDLCYPLVVYICAILFAFFASVFNGNLLTNTVSFFFFTYGMYSTTIMVTSIFVTTIFSLAEFNKTKSKDKEKHED